MVTLAQVRDYVKSLGVCKTVYIGRIDATKKNVLGVYNRQNNTRHAVIGPKTYDCTPISVLIHGDTNKSTTEALANKMYSALENATGAIGDKRIYFVDLLFDTPIDVDQDANKTYEYTIDFNIYTER